MGKLSFMAGIYFTPELARLLNRKKYQTTMPLSRLIWSLQGPTFPRCWKAKGDPYPCRGASITATAAPHTFEAVTAVFECAGQPFTVKGKTILCEGWKQIYAQIQGSLKNKPKRTTQTAT